MEYPDKLFKYLPSKYINDISMKGILLFRNLTYFRQSEDCKRGDPLEGFHRDHPDEGISIHVKRTGELIKGDFSFLNSTNTDLIYVFCMSTILSSELYIEFESDACIEITNVKEFLDRVYYAFVKLPSIHNAGLLKDKVKYYKDNEPAEFNIKNPQNLSFAKGIRYQHQSEFRITFGMEKAFNLTQQIVTSGYDFINEAKKGKQMKLLLEIGSLEDITKIHLLY